MQFRRQGKRIQVLGYRGYDREKRRAKVEFLGSLDAYSYNPTVGLIESLTVEQKIELQAYVEKSRQSQCMDSKRVAIKYLDSHIASVSDSLSDDLSASHMTDDVAQSIYTEWDRLSRAMRKRGHARRSSPSVDTPVTDAEAPLLDAIRTAAETSSTEGGRSGA